MTTDTDEEIYRNEPKRETVRVQPMYLDRSLHARAECAQCKQRPRSQDVFIVHVDRATDDRDQIKSQAFLACSEACRDELHEGLTVDYAMLGVRSMNSAKDAVCIAHGEEPPPKPEREEDSEEDV